MQFPYQKKVDHFSTFPAISNDERNPDYINVKKNLFVEKVFSTKLNYY
jgi:hypothetical protein